MRKPNWAKTIAEELHKHKATEFVWGKSDCCLVIADIVEAFTDHDMASAFRNRYSTEIGSKRALVKYAEGTIDSVLDAQYTRTDEPKRGDIAVVTTDNGDSLGIVFSQSVWVMSMGGLIDLPMSLIKQAWRIE